MTPGGSGNNFVNFFSGNQHNNLQILDAMTDKDINKNPADVVGNRFETLK